MKPENAALLSAALERRAPGRIKSPPGAWWLIAPEELDEILDAARQAGPIPRPPAEGSFEEALQGALAAVTRAREEVEAALEANRGSAFTIRATEFRIVDPRHPEDRIDEDLFELVDGVIRVRNIDVDRCVSNAGRTPLRSTIGPGAPRR